MVEVKSFTNPNRRVQSTELEKMRWALPKQCDHVIVGPCPGNTNMRLFWDLIHSLNTSREMWTGKWSVETKCMCLSVSKRKKRTIVRGTETKTLTSEQLQQEAIKRHALQTINYVCVCFFLLLCVKMCSMSPYVTQCSIIILRATLSENTHMHLFATFLINKMSIMLMEKRGASNELCLCLKIL